MENITVIDTHNGMTTVLSTIDSYPSAVITDNSISTPPVKVIDKDSMDLDNIGSPDWCSTFDFMNYVIILGIITIFGIPGNVISAITLWPKINTNSTSLLLVMLAVFDNCILTLQYIGKAGPIICVYFSIGKTYMNYVYPFFQAFGWYLVHIMVLWASFTIVLISFCRYIAVCRPHNTERFTSLRKIRVILLVIIVGCVVFYSPRFLRSTVELNESRTKLVRKLTAFANSTAFFVYNAPIYYLVSFLIPFTILVVLTYFQVKALKASKEKRSKMTKSKREEHDVTITLIIVVIVFMICQIWEPIRRLAEQLPGPYTDCSRMKYHAYSLKVFFTSVNSAINIVIYCIFGKQFRRDMMRRVFRYNKVHPLLVTTAHPDESTAGKKLETSEVNI